MGDGFVFVCKELSYVTQSLHSFTFFSVLFIQTKNPPAMQETLVWFLRRADPLEQVQANHSSILGLPLWLSWLRICLQCGRPGFGPWVGKFPWRRERLPTPVFWPGEFHGLYSPWGHKESDTTEQLSLHFTQSLHSFTFFQCPLHSDPHIFSFSGWWRILFTTHRHEKAGAWRKSWGCLCCPSQFQP